MQSVTGKSIVSKIAVGQLRVYRKRKMHWENVSRLSPEEELARFSVAREEAREQLRAIFDQAMHQAGEEEATIFEIHQMMLDDEDYVDAIETLIKTENATAEYAVTAAGSSFSAMFASMDDTYMQARASDVKDISDRMVSILAGYGQDTPQSSAPFIIAADDLTPSEIMQLDKSKLLGCITRYGSINSHTAILARTMNIPAIINVDFDDAWDGKTAVLDGYNNCVYIAPTPELLSEMEGRRRQDEEQTAVLQDLKGLPNTTLDGTDILVYANIGNAEEADAALVNDAQGIGLFRSEFIYLESEDYPTEEQQFQIYKKVVESMAGRRVIIRTLDIGADKQVDYFHIGKEQNPAMGYRAIRICLTQKAIFKQQLRAILRSSAFGRVAIMFPMIISVQEVRAAKVILDECRAELQAEGIAVGDVEVGIMIETPAAVMIASELAEEVDFFSIGTNDLTQYTLAIDRQNPKVDHFCDPHHPAILRMIRMSVEAAHSHGCWVGLCGELGADEALIETFLQMRMDELSVSPAAILPLRKKIRSLNLQNAKVENEMECTVNRFIF